MKWEYKFVTLWETVGDAKERNISLLNNRGQEGWELVFVDNKVAYFKRPIEPEIPIYKDGVKLDDN